MYGAQQVAAPPAPWTVQHCRSQPGCFYFYNPTTGVSQWDRPTADPRVSSSSSSLRSSTGTGSITASHILIKHRDSRNPYSWRDKDRKITKTKEEAIRQLQSLALSGDAVQFGKMAEKISDCSSARSASGSLGSFEYGKMQPAFSAAAFALKVWKRKEKCLVCFLMRNKKGRRNERDCRN
jgi:NIMA-interacting peptidyl-prolyl cis-trans isomerase 1